MIDSFKISFPLNKEWVSWENIDKIEFHTVNQAYGSIGIKVKEMDLNRNKLYVPRVFDDFDDDGCLDFSLYRLDLESLKINHERLYLTILDLSKKSEKKRQIHINNYTE